MKDKNIKKVNMIKVIVGLGVAVGVTAIVGGAIKSVTPATTNMLKKACIGLGGFAISGIITDAATNYSDKTVDKVVESYYEVKNSIDQMNATEQEV